MKKWKYFLAFIVCWMFCGLLAKADIIYEPPDSFYQRHASECEHVNRAFIADGPGGVVYLYKSPESPRVMETLQNGNIVRIYFTFQDNDGILWGVCAGGWVPMEYLEVVYDSISFAADYAADILEQKGILDEQYMEQTIYLWAYPGSESGTEIPAQGNMPQYSSVYIDEAGRSWGNIMYYYGIKNTWLCIDAPTQDFALLFPDGAPQVKKTSSEDSIQKAEQESKRIVPKPNHRVVLVTAGIVLGIVLVTAVLLLILKRTGKKL